VRAVILARAAGCADQAHNKRRKAMTFCIYHAMLRRLRLQNGTSPLYLVLGDLRLLTTLSHVHIHAHPQLGFFKSPVLLHRQPPSSFLPTDCYLRLSFALVSWAAQSRSFPVYLVSAGPHLVRRKQASLALRQWMKQEVHHAVSTSRTLSLEYS
jgi:hypothetical protein